MNPLNTLKENLICLYVCLLYPISVTVQSFPSHYPNNLIVISTLVSVQQIRIIRCKGPCGARNRSHQRGRQSSPKPNHPTLCKDLSRTVHHPSIPSRTSYLPKLLLEL